MPTEAFAGPSVDWFALAPLLVLVGGALGLLLLGALTPRWRPGWYAFATASVLGATGVLAVVNWVSIGDDGPRTLMGGALAFDVLAQFLTIVICATTLLVVLVSDDALRASDLDEPEVYALYLLAAVGAIVMAAANDLIVLFIGLESLSLALYVLAASARRRSGSQESGLKYFVLGGFASAVFLYGIALVYGGTGSTDIGGIIASLQGPVVTGSDDTLTLAGIALLVVGLGFKVGAVPFHQWVPDVYQGAPTPVTALMGSVGKAAAIGAMVRVLVIGLPFFRDDWGPVIWVLAVASLVIGPILAFVQTDVKRIIAYSSITHVGFMLAAIEAASATAGEPEPGFGIPAVVLYLLFYGVITVGTLGVVTVVARSSGGDTSLAALAGLHSRRPLLAVSLTILLLAQAGVPFTTGFVAKFGVIWAAVESTSYAIALVALIAAVIAAFVYLRVMITVWLADDSAASSMIGIAVDDASIDRPIRVPVAAGLAIVAAAAFTVIAGILPMTLVDLALDVTSFAR